MELILAVLFLLGASLGSFLNVAALRFLSGESFMISRSHCPHCRTALTWHELIPVFSYIVQRGRCRACRESITIRYLLVEFSMGTFAVLLGLMLLGGLATPFAALGGIFGAWEIPFLLLLYLSVGAVSFFVILVDYDTQMIPIVAVRFLIALGLALFILQGWLTQSLDGWGTIVTALSIALFFLFLWGVTRGRGMGLGDAELGAALVLYLPPLQGLGLLLFSFWSGAIWSVGLMTLSGHGLKSRIAFGPFIVLGFLIALFWGEPALSYLVPFQYH